MLDTAAPARPVPKAEWAERVPALRAALLEAQFELQEAAAFPVVVIVSGADGAGKGDTVNRLHEWLDPRGIATHVFGPLTDDERDRPPLWRFWRTLPARGRIGLFFGSWYTDPIVRRAYRESGKAEFDRGLERIAAFERALSDDGALIVKFWLHLSKKSQRARLAELAGRRRTRWRVTPTDWKHLGLYDRFRPLSERALRATHGPHARWVVVDAADDRHRDITVGETLLRALRARLDGPPAPPPPSPARRRPVPDALGSATRPGPAEDYKAERDEWQGRLSRLTRKAHREGVATVLVFEGWDAAGKGGVIRRVTQAIDARLYTVVPIAAPSTEERAHHYLWRFWRHVPQAGHLTVFDRSWYGRVLVERVEGFAGEDQWRRAYGEIREFERQLAEHGIVLLKFWLHVSPEEQLRRFQERAQTPFKRHKITAEDWRNREKWGPYVEAVNEMIAETSAEEAPWEVVPAEDKQEARLRVLKAVSRRLKRALR
jgi:polyphosphate:AMP phosphotransferase